MTLLKQRMPEDLRIRNYAATTVECSVRPVADFARHFNKSPDFAAAQPESPPAVTGWVTAPDSIPSVNRCIRQKRRC